MIGGDRDSQKKIPTFTSPQQTQVQDSSFASDQSRTRSLLFCDLDPGIDRHERKLFNSRSFSFESPQMFHGSRSFEGSPILSDIALFVGFLTTVLYFAQDPSLEIPILDVVQTLCCWPSFLEGFLITICLWAFRHIERMLSVNGFLAFLLYNAITYIPFFILVLKLKGFHARFSLLGFVPHSLYIFMVWRLPSVMFTEPLTDKFVISLSMLLVLTARFPYSIMSLLSAAFGYWAWNSDLFRIREFFSVPTPEISALESPLETVERELEPSVERNDEGLQVLLDMGVSPDDARAALDAQGGDPNRAAQMLFG
jgi:hypothetical protein